MDIDGLLDKEAVRCAYSIHKLSKDKQEILRRARERHIADIPNPTNVRLAELVGVSETSIRRYFKYGCNCG